MFQKAAFQDVSTTTLFCCNLSYSTILTVQSELCEVIFNSISAGIKTGGGTKILITQQAVNSTKSIKIQPKPEPGANSVLPVVSVPKINKGKSSNG